MIAQVNLLPNIKDERLKAQHLRRTIISVASGVVVIAIAVPILLLIVHSGQKLLLARTQDTINKHIETVRNTPDITTQLTVKDHLASLPALYAQRVRMSQLLRGLPAVIPQQVTLSNIDATSEGRISFSGSTPTYKIVDSFYTALQNAKVAVDPEKVEPDPNITGRFTNVVLENVGGVAGTEVSFTITAQFDLSLVSNQGNQNAQN